MAGDAGNKPRLVSEGPFFAQLWESVLYDPNLKSTDKVVYAVLQRYANQFGSDSVFPSQETIANKISMNREAVNIALQNLVTHGHITRERKGNNWVVTMLAPVGKSDKTVGKSDEWVLENPTSSVGKPSTIRETQSNEENTESFAPSEKEPYTKDFEEFWKAYGPTNGPKRPAFNRWKVMSKANQALALERLSPWLDCRQWTDGFKPYPQKYLGDKIFESLPVDTERPKPTSNGRAPYNDEKRPIPSGMPDYLSQPAKSISPDKLSELRAMRGKT